MNEHAGCDRIQINLQAEVDRLRVELAEGRDLGRLSLVETDEQAAQLVQAEAAIDRLHAELADLRREYDLMEAERDASDDRRDEMVVDLDVERQRADSEIDRLRAELAHAHDERAWHKGRAVVAWRAADKAEAAIARVRELCGPDSWDIELDGIPFIDQRNVLRALDGAE